MWSDSDQPLSFNQDEEQSRAQDKLRLKSPGLDDWLTIDKPLAVSTPSPKGQKAREAQ